MKKLLLGLLLSFPLLSHAADKEPPPPDQVYKVSASATPGTISVHWDIAPGFYLYKDKFQFLSHVTGIRLGKPQLPAGEMKTDPYFGKQEIYHKGVTASLSYSGVGKLDLELVYQGCAETGFCYPPQHKHLSLDLVAPSGATPTPAAATAAIHPPSLEAIAGNAGDSGDINNFPPAEQVFHFGVVAKDQNTLELRWQITPGYYLYRQKFDLKSDNPDVQLGTPDFPQGTIKNDQYFGTSEIYTTDVDVLVPLTRSNGATAFHLIVSYQGCAEAGLCYPPITQNLALDLAAVPPLPSAGAASAPPMAEQDRIADIVKNANLAWVFIAFIGFGLLLTFTPCVLPMLPIISGIIVGQGKKLTTRRAFLLSLTYVLGMAATYTVAGIVVGLAGANVQAALQNPWVLGSFSLLFVVLALSMFGFYELQMPGAVQTWLTKHSNAQKSEAYVGVGIMGALSALICGPCITAPLVGALIVIGETGSGLRGGVALFGLGLGMGLPLLVVGTSAGKLLPKVGAWMNAVKQVFGVVMLGVAIWFLARVIPGPLTLALWAALAIVCGVYLGALEHGTQSWQRLWKGLGLLALLYGLILLIGAATGGDDPFRPLARFGMSGAGSLGAPAGMPGATNQSDSVLPFKRIKTGADLDRELAAAAGKPVMLDFAAGWCVSCKEMEHEVYAVPEVQAALKGAVLLQADWTAYDDADKALGKELGVVGPPTVLFFGPDGKELSSYRVTGYEDRDKFLQSVQGALGSH